MKPTRAEYLRALVSLVGTPYIYAGRGPTGVDCSGAISRALRLSSGGTIDLDAWWTDKMWTTWPPVIEPLPGDACFYGGEGPDVSHVMVLLTPPGRGVPDGLVIGSSGGGRNCTTPEQALRLGAGVHAKPGVHYRDDFRGFRSMAAYLREGP